MILYCYSFQPPLPGPSESNPPLPNTDVLVNPAPPVEPPPDDKPPLPPDPPPEDGKQVCELKHSLCATVWQHLMCDCGVGGLISQWHTAILPQHEYCCIK